MTRKTISSGSHGGQQAMYAVSRALKYLEAGEPDKAVAVCTEAIRRIQQLTLYGQRPT